MNIILYHGNSQNINVSLSPWVNVTPFNALKSGDVKATLQFKFQGDIQGICQFIIADGKIIANNDRVENANLTINSPFELWLDIMTGKVDGQQMFMEKIYG